MIRGPKEVELEAEPCKEVAADSTAKHARKPRVKKEEPSPDSQEAVVKIESATTGPPGDVPPVQYWICRKPGERAILAHAKRRPSNKGEVLMGFSDLSKAEEYIVELNEKPAKKAGEGFA